MTVFFTADLHFGHKRVAELRGFESVMEHDLAICANWREVVQTGDQVWVLGDIAMGDPSFAMRLLEQLPAEKHLILGNHDKGHPTFRASHKMIRNYYDCFVSVQQSARRKILKQSVLLSHFPYDGDHTEEDREQQFRLRDLGLPLIHGHTHLRSIKTTSLNGSSQFHVGLDAHHLTPVPLSVLEEWISYAQRAQPACGKHNTHAPHDGFAPPEGSYGPNYKPWCEGVKA